MVNEDVTDLYARVNVGTKVVVLPMGSRHDVVATRSAPAVIVPPAEQTPAPTAASWRPFWMN
jgi:hypothetical protein